MTSPENRRYPYQEASAAQSDRSIYEQLEYRKPLLRDLAVELAFLIVGFRRNAPGLQRGMDRIADSAPLGQDENLAGMPPCLLIWWSTKAAIACASGDIRELHDPHLAGAVGGDGHQLERLPVRIVPDKSIGDGNNTRGTTVAVQERVIGAARMCPGEGSDSLGVCMLETVERLVIVAYDAERRTRAQQIDNSLLGLVEILVFIDQHVVKKRTLRSGRIIAQIAIKLRDDFADQHAFVESQPGDQHILKGGIGRRSVQNQVVRAAGVPRQLRRRECAFRGPVSFRS